MSGEEHLHSGAPRRSLGEFGWLIMANTSLNALHSFIAVARQLSYAAAAKDLGVTASALSQSVRGLEEQLGVTLLNRTTRSVSLTDEGRRLLETAGPAIDQAVEALRSVDLPSGVVTGTVRISVPTAAVSMVLARVLPRFARAYPGVKVDVRVEDNFVDTVAEGLDAGIRLIHSIDLDMVQVRLTEPAHIIVAGAPSYFERHGRPTTPDELQHHECLRTRFSPTRVQNSWRFEQDDRSWRVPVDGPVTSDSFALTVRLAVEGIGLLYTLEPKLEGELARGELEVVLAEYAPMVPGLFLYYPSRAQVSPALAAFVEVARAAMLDC